MNSVFFRIFKQNIMSRQHGNEDFLDSVIALFFFHPPFFLGANYSHSSAHVMMKYWDCTWDSCLQAYALVF